MKLVCCFEQRIFWACMIQQDLADIDHVLLRIRESDWLNRQSLFAVRKQSGAIFLERKISFIFL